MKPDWKDAPEWARFVAMDPDGNWFWFSEEPRWDERLEIWHTDRKGTWGEARVKPQFQAPASLEPRP